MRSPLDWQRLRGLPGFSRRRSRLWEVVDTPGRCAAVSHTVDLRVRSTGATSSAWVRQLDNITQAAVSYAMAMALSSCAPLHGASCSRFRQGL